MVMYILQMVMYIKMKINYLSVASFAIIFSHPEGCSVSFAVQNLLRLISTESDTTEAA